MTTSTLATLGSDARLLFLTRGIRMFAYGLLSVVLVLYLKAIGLREGQIGVLLTMTLLGDVIVSLILTSTADRFGRKRILVVGAMLIVLVGVAFALTNNYYCLLIVATLGVLSPSDKEVGPFLSIEQAALSQATSEQQRTAVFAWYNLFGSLTAAFGALAAGFISHQLFARQFSEDAVYRPLIFGYAAIGILLAILFLKLSSSCEAAQTKVDFVEGNRGWFGLTNQSRRAVFQLSTLFALDAFGGGFVIQSIVAYWFHVRYQVDPALLGSIFFVANLLAAASALGASYLAKRFGLINTMVFTHLPSNVLLILVPLMPNLTLAVIILFLRFAISQMDVPTRQSYTMAVVKPEERSAASGLTTIARSLGAAVSPLIAGICLEHPELTSVPFFVAGGIKIVYDILLYRAYASRDSQLSHRT
jgi:MFS family permease